MHTGIWYQAVLAIEGATKQTLCRVWFLFFFLPILVFFCVILCQIFFHSDEFELVGLTLQVVVVCALFKLLWNAVSEMGETRLKGDQVSIGVRGLST